jgi:hypothetical protein
MSTPTREMTIVECHGCAAARIRNPADSLTRPEGVCVITPSTSQRHVVLIVTTHRVVNILSHITITTIYYYSMRSFVRTIVSTPGV